MDLTLLHRCLCIETTNEHMVCVPAAHEQTLAYDVLEMARAGCLGAVCSSRRRGKLWPSNLAFGHPSSGVTVEKDMLKS